MNLDDLKKEVTRRYYAAVAIAAGDRDKALSAIDILADLMPKPPAVPKAPPKQLAPPEPKPKYATSDEVRQMILASGNSFSFTTIQEIAQRKDLVVRRGTFDHVVNTLRRKGRVTDPIKRKVIGKGRGGVVSEFKYIGAAQ